MRFVWAVAAFVLAAVLIGAGIAQRTIFQGPPSQQTQIEIADGAPFVLIDGAVLRSHPGAQTLLVRGKGEIFAAYGRDADMQAWLADSDYNHVTVADDGSVVVERIDAPEPEAADEPQTTDEPEATDEPPATDEQDSGTATNDPAVISRNPVGSDLWLDSFRDEDALIADNMQLPEGVSVLVSYDGDADAPDDITVSWPLDNSTPWAGPLMTAGGIMLFIGLVLYVLAIRHQRRGRGPRRKGPGPLPVTQPIDIAELPPAERAAIGAASDDAPDQDGAAAPASDPEHSADGAPAADPDAGSGRATMSTRRPARRRLVLALPALTITAVLATGCSPDSWPQFGEGSPSPSPSPTVIAPDNQKPPAVTEAQANRIVQEISSTLADADAAVDIELAKTRLAGPALAARTTDYALRAAIPESPVPAEIPTDRIEIVLPEATDRWPRTVLALTKSASDDTIPPVILTMTQQDPWSNYRVSNMAEMSADAVFPEVAATWLGTSLVPADSAFLSVAPGELAAAFADVVDAREASPYFGEFDELSLALAQSIVDSRQAVVQTLADNGAAETSTATFDLIPSEDAPIAMTTLNAGAIVAVSLHDIETIAPTSADAVIRFGDNAQAKALTGATESAKGVETTYEFQLFFAVPTQGSTEQIKLLGVRQDLLSVKVIQ